MAAIWAGVLPSPRTTSGKPWRTRAIMVDAGEPQVFERPLAQHREQLGVGGGRVDLAARDGGEERLQL